MDKLEMVNLFKVHLFGFACVEINCPSNSFMLIVFRSRHCYCPIVLLKIDLLFLCYHLRKVLLIIHLSFLPLHWLHSSHPLFALVQYRSLAAQDLSSFLESCYNVHILTNFTSLDQCDDSFLQVLSFDDILLCKRVQSHLSWKNISLFLQKSWLHKLFVPQWSSFWQNAWISKHKRFSCWLFKTVDLFFHVLTYLWDEGKGAANWLIPIGESGVLDFVCKSFRKAFRSLCGWLLMSDLRQYERILEFFGIIYHLGLRKLVHDWLDCQLYC